VAGILVAGWLLQHDGPVAQLSRTLGAVAAISEEGSDLLIAALRTSGSFTQAAGHWAADVISSSRDLSREAWNGIQLVNASMKAEAGTFVAEGPEVMLAWLQSAEAVQLMAGFPEIREEGVVATKGVLFGLPLVTKSVSSLDRAARFSRAELVVAATGTLQVTLTWRLFSANFSVQWANPLWDMLELDASVNGSEINRIILNYMRGLPVPPPAPPTVMFVKPVTFTDLVNWKVQKAKRGLSWYFDWFTPRNQGRYGVWSVGFGALDDAPSGDGGTEAPATDQEV